MRADIKERIEKINRGEVPKGYYNAENSRIIPKKWSVKQIKDICPLQRGFDLPNHEIIDGKYPVCYSNGTLRRHKEYKVTGPGVTTGRSGTIGNVFYVEENYWPHNTSLWVTDFKLNYPKYIYYLLNYIKLERFLAGTGVPTLNRNDVHIHKEVIPPLAEQKNIVSILSTWDKAIELKEKLIQQKKEQKKGLRQNLLTGKVRFEGFDVEWKKSKIGDLVKSINRKIQWNDEKLYDLVSVKRRSGGLFYRQSLYGYEIQTKSLQVAKENDFIISKMQVVHGALSIVNKEFDGMYVSNSYIILNSKDKKFNIKFFHYLTKLPEMYNKAYISSYGVHIEKMTFNLQLYLNETITIPSDVEEQNKIVNILETQEKEINLLTKELENLKEQKKGLMQLLLIGKVRVEC